MIKLSANTTTCTYKHTEADIWPAIPRETERFTTSKEFSQIDIQIFNHLLETPTKPENEVDIEDGYSDFDDTNEDPDYEPGRPKDLLPTEDEHTV